VQRLTGVTLFVFGFIASLFSYSLRLSLPKKKGVLRISGIEYPVTIRTDSRGIPFIETKTRSDLFFAMGFTHAQDRMWQMDLMRRIASGTLSELVGEKALVTDRFMRRVGLYRTTAEQYPFVSARIRNDLESYAAGVNAYRKTLSWFKWWRLPVEYLLLRSLPKEWKAQDSAVIAKFLAFVLSPNWDTQIVRIWLSEKLGPEQAAFFEPPYPSPFAVPPADFYGPELLKEYQAFSQWLPVASASNAWVVDKTKSKTGMPLLANDIHNPASFPGLWYEMCAHGANIAMAGVSIPGLPAIIAGRNKRIAWGISSGMANQQDIFIEKLNPRNPCQYRFENAWEDGRVVTETIYVRGQKEPVSEEVLITRHGPLIHSLIPGMQYALALRSTCLDSLELLVASAKLVTAQNWRQFRRALSFWSTPSMNFVYADTAGNIGYQFAGFIPNRADRSGLIPARGWCIEDEWQGRVPFDSLPTALNSKKYFAAAANNQPEYQDTRFSGEWADPYRMKRIAWLISAKYLLTLDDFRAMHQDVYSQVAREVLAFVRSSGIETTDERTAWAYRQLMQWDRRIETTSIATSIFEAFGYFLYRNVFSQKLGTLFEYYIGAEVHPIADINAFAYRSASNMVRILRNFQNVFPDADERKHIVQKSLDDALAFLEKKLGKDPTQWEWGKLHTVSFSHAFSQIPFLGKRWSFGPHPLAGDVNTIPQASYKPLEPFEAKASVVMWRHLVDLANFDCTESVMVPGQSGHPASKNASDQIATWLATRYFKVPFSEKLIHEHARNVLTLRPRP